MKTFVPTTVLMLFAAIPAAQAAPIYTPHLEEHVASGELQARQLRSQLASRFSVSRDYREIMREADHVVAALDALHERRSQPAFGFDLAIIGPRSPPRTAKPRSAGDPERLHTSLSRAADCHANGIHLVSPDLPSRGHARRRRANAD